MGKSRLNFYKVKRTLTPYSLAKWLADWKSPLACQLYCSFQKNPKECDHNCEQNIFTWLMSYSENEDVPDKV